MKKVEFKVPIFDVDVVLIQVEDISDEEEAMKIYKSIEPTEEQLKDVEFNIKNNLPDGGNTLFNFDYQCFVVVFYRMSNKKKLVSAYAHEKRHIEDRILNICNIKDEETAGYIAGYLAPYFEELKDMYFISSEISEQKQ